MINRRKLLSLAASSCLLPAIGGRSMSEEMTAREAGFYMPLESLPHVRTFMQWPSDLRVYDSKKELNRVRATIALIANTIQQFEPVVVLAGKEFAEEATGKLKGEARIWTIPTQDLWARDSGPSFLIDDKGNTAISELNFNGWGAKQNVDLDKDVAAVVAKKMGVRVFDNLLVGEGGGVEVDGDGTLLAHASCWVNDNRNSESQNVVTQQLCNAFGVEKVIWAPGLIGQDITDYHIDSLARFVKPGQVVIQLPDKSDNSQWAKTALETYNILKNTTDAKGRKLEIVALPSPQDIRSTQEDFLSSYANYYVCNGAVIVAEFGDDKTDAAAVKILGELYPERKIVSLNVDPLGELGGGIHCATQQQPKA